MDFASGWIFSLFDGYDFIDPLYQCRFGALDASPGERAAFAERYLRTCLDENHFVLAEVFDLLRQLHRRSRKRGFQIHPRRRGRRRRPLPGDAGDHRGGQIPLFAPSGELIRPGGCRRSIQSLQEEI